MTTGKPLAEIPQLTSYYEPFKRFILMIALDKSLFNSKIYYKKREKISIALEESFIITMLTNIRNVDIPTNSLIRIWK